MTGTPWIDFVLILKASQMMAAIYFILFYFFRRHESTYHQAH